MSAMSRTADAPGLLLAVGLAAIVAAALAPAGLDGRPIPPGSWLVWCGVLTLALAGFGAAGVRPVGAAGRIAWLLPLVAVLALPAAMLAAPGTRLAVACGLMLRAIASASAAAALATLLGPPGIVRGLRQLRVPPRLVDIFGAALAGLTVVLRQASAMLRAREARRPAHGAWSMWTADPVATSRGFGRLVAALLLRSLERGEALERARRARGGGPA
jgi:energy-coupling factor transporter transmembrane protein EcfT